MKQYKLLYGYHKRYAHDNNVIREKTVICSQEDLNNELSKFEEECGGRGDNYAQEPFAWVDLKYNSVKEISDGLETKREKKIYDILNWGNASYYDRLQHIYALFGMDVPNDGVKS